MWKNLYAVYDSTAETIVGSIIMENTDAPAIRAFHDALKTPQSLLSQHPDDYNLICLGTISADGQFLFTDVNRPSVIATGSAWKESQNNA